MRNHLAVLTAVLTAVMATGASAQTSFPFLMSAKPTAAQVGTTSEVTVGSRYSMYGAYQVLVTGRGVTGEVVPHAVNEGEKEPDLTSLKVNFTVADDALPGVRDFRIATPRGVSTVGQLVIVRDQVVSESSDNDTSATAQAVTLPATLAGTIEKAEDVDYYKFSVEAGTTLVMHVRAQRLEDRIHDLQTHVDPILSVRGSNGSVLAQSDNAFCTLLRLRKP